jgi:hypothetical protein
MIASPSDLRDYAKFQGWHLLKDAIKDRLFVLTNPDFAGRQLVFPMDSEAPDYGEAVGIVVGKLAAFQRQPEAAIMRAISEIRTDTLRFHLFGDLLRHEQLPMAFAASVVSATEKLLRAAACSVLRPQSHHPRLSGSEVQELLDVAQFRPPEGGSFTLTVSIPIRVLDASSPCLTGPVPFAWRTTAIIQQSLENLVSAIEADTVDQLVQETKTSESPLLSSNFCDALAGFGDEHIRNELEISIQWSSALFAPATGPFLRRIRLQPDYFPRIQEIGQALKSTGSYKEETFIGTVEKLEGELSPEGRRTGNVILQIFHQDDDELVLARANLNSEQYDDAYKAHGHAGCFVMATGKLRPGRQPQSLMDITHFKIIQHPNGHAKNSKAPLPG